MRCCRKTCLVCALLLVSFFGWLLMGKEAPTDPRLLAFPSRILDPRGCLDARTLFVVHSRAGNVEQRNRVRRIFHDAVSMKVFFVLGWSDNVQLEHVIHTESCTHKDILQFHFIDSYYNLTIKALSWLRYARDYCPSTNFIVKMDDDVLVDMPLFRSKLSSLVPGVIYGTVWHHQPIRRSRTSKWFVPYSLYPQKVFPDYCSGSAYVLSTNIASRLVEGAERSRSYIHVDDAFITGIVAEAVGIQRTSKPEWWNLSRNTTKDGAVFILT